MSPEPLNVPLPECQPPLPSPEPIHTVPVKWAVITSRQPPDGDWVYIALTPREYENLAKNSAEVLRWIEEAVYRLDYYEERGENGPE